MGLSLTEANLFRIVAGGVPLPGKEAGDRGAELKKERSWHVCVCVCVCVVVCVCVWLGPWDLMKLLCYEQVGTRCLWI